MLVLIGVLKCLVEPGSSTIHDTVLFARPSGIRNPVVDFQSRSGNGTWDSRLHVPPVQRRQLLRVRRNAEQVPSSHFHSPHMLQREFVWWRTSND